MTISHENISDSAIATKAQQFAGDLNLGWEGGTESKAVQEVAQAQKDMTPAQYTKLLADMNNDLKTALPFLTITGTTEVNGSPNLVIKDNQGTPFDIPGDASGAKLIVAVGQYEEALNTPRK